MFWRFGLTSSVIDGLLDKEDLTLEDLLDEDDLLQECKAHNNKLIEYLRDPIILSQLLNYIIREDLDDRQKFKYPYVACEVLSCEIWAICEAAIDNPDLLETFWQILDRPPRLNPLQASYFYKVNVVFLQKKTSEMVKFVQSIPNVVSKLLKHMETSAIMDLLLKLISVEEYPEGTGVIEWLNSEGLIQALISKLNPNLDSEIHSTAAQVITDIIAISQSSTPEQGGVGPNALSRELISEKTVSQLVDYMLDTESPSSTSTLINGVSIFIQIIQKNNCDYHEETMQHSAIDLSDMLRVLANRIGEFKKLLENPKSVKSEINTTIGKIMPLGFERFKICELLAELLHCSNMSLLNALPPEPSTNGFFELKKVGEYNDHRELEPTFIPAIKIQSQKLYDLQTSQVGWTSVDTNSGVIKDTSAKATSKETPIPLVSALMESSANGDIINNSEVSDGDVIKNSAVSDGHVIKNSEVSDGDVNGLKPSKNSQIPVGDLLKQKFIDHKILPTCLDLFFTFKWNNFLHTVVYDMIAQIFTGRMDIGYNKALAISIFTDGQLTKRITVAQNLNEKEVKKSKGIRLGYMGHLTYIAEEVVKLLDRYPVEIGEKVRDYIEAVEWQEYVSKTLRETRERDHAHLGGQRPSNHDSLSHSPEDSEEDCGIEPSVDTEDLPIDTTGDQFARYLTEQITNELPDKFGSSDEEEDEDDSWADPDYDLPEGDPFENRHSSLAGDLKVDSDEEAPSIQWPSNNETKQLLTVADWSADFQSGFNKINGGQASMNTVELPSISAVTKNHNPVATAKNSSTSKSVLTSPISSTIKSPEKSISSSYSEGHRSQSIEEDEEEEDNNDDVKLPIYQESALLENVSTTAISREEKFMDFATFDKMGIQVKGVGDDGLNEKTPKIGIPDVEPDATQSTLPSTPVSSLTPFISSIPPPLATMLTREPTLTRMPTAATISLAPTTTTTVVTTTTTTTTTFPPLLLRPPPLPKELDPKDYPLADTPTPPALKRFCFDLNGEPTYFREDEDSEEAMIKLQEALYNMRASGPTSTSTTRTIQAISDSVMQPETKLLSLESAERKISGIGSRKRPASPVEIPFDIATSGHQKVNNSGTYGSKASHARRSLSPPHKKARAKSAGLMLDDDIDVSSILKSHTPFNNFQGETSTPGSSSITIQPTPASSTRHFNNTITNSNLGIDTPSTTRSTHSSALPSPSLSPITGDSILNGGNQFESFFGEHTDRDDSMIDDNGSNAHTGPSWTRKSQDSSASAHVPSLLDLPTMLSTFDALPSSMQSYMLFHLLRRCPTNTLQYVSNIILPALRRDFLGILPLELSLQIVRYLDAPSMCRAARVSKRWRTVIDGDGFTWKRRLEADGFGIDEGEESRAVSENWGTLRSIKPANHRNKQLNCTLAVKEESGASSSEERTVVENDEDNGENMRLERTVAHDRLAIKIENKNLLMSNDIRDSLHDQMSLDIDQTFHEKNNEELNLSSIPYMRRFASPQRCDKGKGRSDRQWSNFRTEVSQNDDDRPYDGDDSDVDGMSQGSSERADITEENLPLVPSAGHPYKAIYRRHYLIRQNWNNGRSRHISFPGHGNNVVTCLQFDSDKIISGSDDQCINVYDTNTGDLRKRLVGHDGGVWALQYVDNTLVSGSTDRTVRVWDIERGICTHVFPGHTSTVRCLQIILPQNVNSNPNEPPIVEPPIPLIVTGSRDSTLRVWRLPNPTIDPTFTPNIPSSPSDNSQLVENPYFVRTLQGHTHSVRALAGVGNTLVSGSYDCSVRVWNIMTGECLWRLHGHTQKVYSVVLDAKRKRCMSGSMDGTVKVWSLEDGTCVWTLEGHSSLVGLLDLSHDFLVSAAADSSLRIWNPDDGTCRHVLTAHTGAITCFQHDDHKVISGSDGVLKMWDVRTGRSIRDLLTGLSGVWQVRFDERRCVAAVQRNQVTWFEVLDFGAYQIEERDHDLAEGNGSEEIGEWTDRRIVVNWNDGIEP
ncbi:hypothetical protein G9A89_011030 [Geosiphon pyriformis]|nr:hypothetical protein G9A89_011030 [Geosiphon pyriformis]